MYKNRAVEQAIARARSITREKGEGASARPGIAHNARPERKRTARRYNVFRNTGAGPFTFTDIAIPKGMNKPRLCVVGLQTVLGSPISGALSAVKIDKTTTLDLGAAGNMDFFALNPVYGDSDAGLPIPEGCEYITGTLTLDLAGAVSVFIQDEDDDDEPEYR